MLLYQGKIKRKVADADVKMLSSNGRSEASEIKTEDW